MNKTTRSIWIIASVLLVVLLLSSCTASNVPDGLTYEIENKKATITGYTGKDKNPVIPAEIKNCPVTFIQRSAFFRNKNLTSITLPNSITEIGGNAFGECSNLTTLVIPDGVTYIWPFAFIGCTSLKSITIPASVTYIDDTILTGCPRNITIYVKQNSYAYQWCMTNGYQNNVKLY